MVLIWPRSFCCNSSRPKPARRRDRADRVAETVVKLMLQSGIGVCNSRVLILGLAFKAAPAIWTWPLEEEKAKALPHR